MKKNYYIIATQVNPEKQMNEIYREDFEKNEIFEDFLITGNSDFCSYGHLLSELSMFQKSYDDIQDIVNDSSIDNDEKLFELRKIFRDSHDEENGWKSADISDWEKALEGEDEEILSLITGKKYESCEICGSCQSEWNILYYPAGTSENTIHEIEANYFNTGSEWIVKLHENPSDISDETCLSVYTACYDDDGIRKRIASAVGVREQQIILRKFECPDGNYSAFYTDQPDISDGMKEKFCHDLAYVFKKYKAIDFDNMEYMMNENDGKEYILITKGDSKLYVDVTGENVSAMTYDIFSEIIKAKIIN